MQPGLQKRHAIAKGYAGKAILANGTNAGTVISYAREVNLKNSGRPVPSQPSSSGCSQLTRTMNALGVGRMSVDCRDAPAYGRGWREVDFRRWQLDTSHC